MNERAVIDYLLAHRHELGKERLNWPPIWRFDVDKLPHNEILNDAFFAQCLAPWFTLHEDPDGSWVLSL